MRVIWLSEKDMDKKQEDDLKTTLKKDDLHIIRIVATIPYSGDGAMFILNGVIDHYLVDRYERINGVLAGIFPAHAAAAIARELVQPAVYHSVQYPMKLENGETYMQHSHWEYLNPLRERIYNARPNTAP